MNKKVTIVALLVIVILGIVGYVFVGSESTSDNVTIQTTEQYEEAAVNYSESLKSTGEYDDVEVNVTDSLADSDADVVIGNLQYVRVLSDEYNVIGGSEDEYPYLIVTREDGANNIQQVDELVYRINSLSPVPVEAQFGSVISADYDKGESQVESQFPLIRPQDTYTYLDQNDGFIKTISSIEYATNESINRFDELDDYRSLKSGEEYDRRYTIVDVTESYPSPVILHNRSFDGGFQDINGYNKSTNNDVRLFLE